MTVRPTFLLIVVAISTGCFRLGLDPSHSNGGGFDGVVALLDPLGNIEWIRTLGGPGDDGLDGVALGSDGTIYVTGGFENTGQFAGLEATSDGATDAFVLALDQSGDGQWVYQLGGTGDAWGTDVDFREPSRAVALGATFNGEVHVGSQTLVGAQDALIHLIRVP